MRQTIQEEQVLDPENIMYAMLRDYVQGALDETRVLWRACVVGIDQQGGQFETDPPNPRNTVQARIITDGYNATTSDDDLPIFWPAFPHAQSPIKEGEHIYVIFEDDAREHGLWLTRIPTRLDVDSKNYTKGTAAYAANAQNAALSTAISIDQLVAGTTENPTEIETSDEFVVEDVPEFRARVGDYVIHGSNNTIIVMGTDRTGDVDTPTPGSGAGSIDVVAGRASEDMDFDADEVRVYICRKTDVDTNFGTSAYPSGGSKSPPGPTVGAKSDHIRIVGRKSAKLVVTGGDLSLDGQNINIGVNPTDPAVLGEKLKSLLSDLITAIEGLVILTPAGPGSVDPSSSGQTLKGIANNLDTFLSKTIMVKP